MYDVHVFCSLHICKWFYFMYGYVLHVITFTLILLFCFVLFLQKEEKFFLSGMVFIRRVYVLFSSFKLQFSMRIRYRDFGYCSHFKWTKLYVVGFFFHCFVLVVLLNRKKIGFFHCINSLCHICSVSFSSGEHVIQTLFFGMWIQWQSSIYIIQANTNTEGVPILSGFVILLGFSCRFVGIEFRNMNTESM